MIIVKCREIKKYFPIQRGYLRKKVGIVKAVDNVSLEVGKGETFGLVGESGCGKTTLGKIILGILKPDSGTLSLATNKIQAIFQDPYNSLDPKMKVRDIISEGIVLERRVKGSAFALRASADRQEASLGFVSLASLGTSRDKRVKEKVNEVIDLVKLPESALNKYPHEFSGGERQRIAIARAIVTDPEFIVCDEPVSSLDVTIQLEILRLLKDIQRRFSMTYLFISHDLRVVRFMSDRIAVMKEGRLVEEGPVQKIYSNAMHPYTKLLLSSILDIYQKDGGGR